MSGIGQNGQLAWPVTQPARRYSANVAPAHIVILGLMGAGKTTIGSALAAQLSWPLSDSDLWLLARTGHTARQLRDELGTDELHRLEAEHLLATLASPQRTVICAAASVVEDAACQRALTRQDVAKVWLRGSIGELAARFASGPHRPAYGADSEAFLAEQQARREHLFQACAPIEIDTTAKTPEQVLADVLQRLPG